MKHRSANQTRFERVPNSTDVQASGAADPSFLRALHIVYEQLELQLQRSGALAHARLEHVSQRRQELERMLQAAQVDLCTVDKAALHALVLAQSIRREAADEAALLGFVRALDSVWQRRCEPAPSNIESQPEAAQLAAAISGARGGPESWSRLVELLETQTTDRVQPLSALNFEAGAHPIPRDLREVEAALRAGEQTYREWAYYYARFGERGVRFTRSDSAWIAYVARREERAAQSMFDWLARLLAARGMPRLLFERHLEHLHAELVRALPDHAADYASLLQASAGLKAARLELLADIDALALHFQPRASPTPPPLTAAEASRLLVAAVLDERLGVANAVASLVSWLGDAARFGDDWSQDVERFLHVARAQIS